MTDLAHGSNADVTQRAVARARADVLSGRGPGTDPIRRHAAQRGRNRLGALPTPVERELVALAARLIRTTPRGSVLPLWQARALEITSAWLPSSTAATARLAARR